LITEDILEALTSKRQMTRRQLRGITRNALSIRPIVRFAFFGLN
jgi:hypothetical protein